MAILDRTMELEAPEPRESRHTYLLIAQVLRSHRLKPNRAESIRELSLDLANILALNDSEFDQRMFLEIVAGSF